MNSGSSALRKELELPEKAIGPAQVEDGQDSRTAVAFSEITFDDPPGSMVTP